MCGVDSEEGKSGEPRSASRRNTAPSLTLLVRLAFPPVPGTSAFSGLVAALDRCQQVAEGD